MNLRLRNIELTASLQIDSTKSSDTFIERALTARANLLSLVVLVASKMATRLFL